MAALREIAAHFGVTFDDKALKKGATAITEGIDAIKGFAGSLGAGLALGAVWHFTEGLLEEADALSKHSAVLGISMKSLQEWQYMASLAGVSNEALQATFTKLSGGKGAKGLAKLGIESKKTNGELKLGPELMEEIAEKLSKIENPSERNAKAMAVLGKSYAKLMPLLVDGKEGIEKLKKEFADFGGGWGEETGKDAEEFNDNLTRVKFIWKSFTIGIISSVLPALLQLSRYLIQVAKPFVLLLKQGKLVEAIFAGFALKGVVFLSAKIGPLGKALKMLTSQFFKVIVPLLILEDLMVFLSGGDSAFGRLVEKLFGKGTSDDIRAWIQKVWKEFMGFISQIKNAPLSLLDDWEVLTTALTKDIKSVFGDTFGEMITIAGGMFVSFIDLLTGGWDNMGKKAGAIWDYIVLGGKIVWNELAGGFVNLAAIIGDAFIEAWNFILSGFNKVAGAIDKAMVAVGAMSKSEYDANQKTMAGQYGKADMSDMVNQARAAERTKLAADYDNIQARLNAGTKASAGGSNVGVNTVVNVTVAPGTPAAQAKAVGAAAAAGVGKGVGSLKGAKAALVPGGS